jgi:tRNA(Glu) U13 pseudouridine synthase TruD
VARPQDLAWHWPQPDQLELRFALPAGVYATAVLREIALTSEPDRLADDTAAGVD